MKLYKISQTENNDWDTYDSAIVAAESEDAARLMHPGRNGSWNSFRDWCSTPDAVTVELIGEATPSVAAGVVLASFNAG